mmetsp:Transcript_50169/g.113783  ORF Transcript_50169/g.113783 Transcript_50169/m.113783 type:complete len:459 (+) Transcript_50169:108-1484(+)
MCTQNVEITKLVEDLSQLVKDRSLTSDELGLMYAFKHGSSVNEALRRAGLDEKLEGFVSGQKVFSKVGGRIGLAGEVSSRDVDVAVEVRKILEASGGQMGVASLCSRFIQMHEESLSSMTGKRPAEYFEESEEFRLIGRGVVGLVAKPKREGAVEETDATEKPASKVAVLAGCTDRDEEAYLALHEKIAGRSFGSGVARCLQSIVQAVSEGCCLNVRSVIRGGSIGRGTAITGCESAELVFLVEGLPRQGQEKWVRPLLKSVKAVLSMSEALKNVEFELRSESLHMVVQDCVSIDLKFSPVFENHSETLAEIEKQGPCSQKLFAGALEREMTQFVSKQRGQVKTTMRLLKWWREEQEWSVMCRPSDDVLELVAIYVWQRTDPVEQWKAVANCMTLMCRFNEVRIVWSNYYRKDAIWKPLLSQRPLLMSPVNPYKNVAAPTEFDCSEMMAKAASTHFFW